MSKSRRYAQEIARLFTWVNRAAELPDDWRSDSLCAYSDDPDLWFRPEDTFDARDAAAMCWTCPVREQCLEWASVSKERYGIFGGLPPSVRLNGGDHPHDIDGLLELGNPYEVNPRFRTLREYEPGEDDDE